LFLPVARGDGDAVKADVVGALVLAGLGARSLAGFADQSLVFAGDVTVAVSVIGPAGC
jgi:hypothetical protein